MKILLIYSLILSMFFSCAHATETHSISESSQGLMTIPKEDSKSNEIITEIHLGNKENSEDVINVYISPSCFHCLKLLTNEIEKFVKDDEKKHHIVIKIIPISAKDVFIMKLIQNESNDENSFYIIFANYSKRVLATINWIKPTQKQIDLFKGSIKDPEMINFQVVASEFGFNNEKIVSAYPAMDEEYEIKLMKKYAEKVRFVAKLLNGKELNLPLIEKNGEVYDSLQSAAR